MRLPWWRRILTGGLAAVLVSLAGAEAQGPPARTAAVAVLECGTDPATALIVVFSASASAGLAAPTVGTPCAEAIAALMTSRQFTLFATSSPSGVVYTVTVQRQGGGGPGGGGPGGGRPGEPNR